MATECRVFGDNNATEFQKLLVEFGKICQGKTRALMMIMITMTPVTVSTSVISDCCLVKIKDVHEAFLVETEARLRP